MYSWEYNIVVGERNSITANGTTYKIRKVASLVYIKFTIDY